MDRNVVVVGVNGEERKKQRRKQGELEKSGKSCDDIGIIGLYRYITHNSMACGVRGEKKKAVKMQIFEMNGVCYACDLGNDV